MSHTGWTPVDESTSAWAPVDETKQKQPPKTPPSSLAGRVLGALNPLGFISDVAGAGQAIQDWGQQTAQQRQMEDLSAIARGEKPPAASQFIPNVAATLGGYVRELPSMLGYTAGAIAAPEVVLPYLTYKGTVAALTPQQPSEDTPAALERRLGGAAQVVGAVAGAAQGPRGLQVSKRTTQAALNIGNRAVNKAQAEWSTEVATEQATHQAKVNDILATHKEATFEGLLDQAQKVKELDAAYEQKVADISRKHQMRVEAVRQANELSQQQVAQRSQLTTDSLQTASDLGASTKKAQLNVHEDLSNRWQSWESKTGPDTPLNLPQVQDAVRNAEKNILRGSPERIAIFRALMHESPQLEDASVFGGSKSQTSSGTTYSPLTPADLPPGMLSKLGLSGEEPVALTLRDGRGYSTELGTKLSSGTLPGDIYQAMKSVKESVDGEISSAADRAGTLDEYNVLKKDYARYMKTFHDMSPISQGGSPVARAIRAPDPGYVIGPMTGKATVRAKAQLEQYRSWGAHPELVDTLQQQLGQAQGLPKTAKVTQLPPSPEIPQRPQVTPPKLPSPPTLPPAPTPEQFSPEAFRAGKLDKYAEKLRGGDGWGLYTDVAATGYAIREMLTGQPPWALAFPVARRVVGAVLGSSPVVRSLSKAPASVSPATGAIPAAVATAGQRERQLASDLRAGRITKEKVMMYAKEQGDAGAPRRIFRMATGNGVPQPPPTTADEYMRPQ